ncbi:LOW QUALITY PROTEIN: uncharacterized protein LOC131469970 [Solea solea]|uniref:LOW QUALITY PROTEIN: uncharacterized protein LOC131469970 n=1 Tax=Solea solea TaxID=90069 RepID=UPI00272A8600|nr:LOW QUALITY PROTEIN: uncharacterized protein LOC131469970 [Solea solea]
MPSGEVMVLQEVEEACSGVAGIRIRGRYNAGRVVSTGISQRAALIRDDNRGVVAMAHPHFTHKDHHLQVRHNTHNTLTRTWHRVDNTPNNEGAKEINWSPYHSGYCSISHRYLGPMTKRAVSLTDWQSTFHPKLAFSPSSGMYRISLSEQPVPAILHHELLQRHHGREYTDSEGAGPLLDSMPSSLRATSPTDVGFCSTVAPITFDISEGYVHVPQYYTDPVGRKGIKETIAGLLQAGVLEVTSDPTWNTPILPVEKKGTGKYRMVHDLRLINSKVLTPIAPVPNPHAALAMLSPEHSFFTVVDLANAFFCIPLSQAMRSLFTFTFEGTWYTYTRLPQGFVLSPGIFNSVLRDLLQTLNLPVGTLLVQYVDDLLLGAPTERACLEATGSLLKHLHSCGFKLSRSKLQICRPVVTFLGRVLSTNGTGLSSSHRSTILHHTKPVTVRDMLSFLGLANYSRHYIPDFCDHCAPLRQMINAQGARNLTATLEWTLSADTAFISLKQLLAAAADMCVPDYRKPFHLDVSEKSQSVSAVLFQKKGGGTDRFVNMYCSVTLDPYEAKSPPCARYASALAKILQKTSHLTMGHPVHILTSHSVVQYVTGKLFTMTASRQRKLERVLTAQNLIFKHEGANMADGIVEGEPHECAQRDKEAQTVRSHLYMEPLTNPDLVLFTDGCCFRQGDGLKSSYAVIRQTDGQHTTVKTEMIDGRQSAQRAEMIAMTEALLCATDLTVNIYTDSAYVVTAVHYGLAEWQRTGYVTASGTPVKNADDVLKLHQALHCPFKVAVIKCKGHAIGNDPVARGNRAADEVAKKMAGYVPMDTQMAVLSDNQDNTPIPAKLDTQTMLKIQAAASPEEKSMWKHKGAIQTEDGIWGKGGRPIPPAAMLKSLIEEAHGPTHVGKQETIRRLKAWWHPFIQEMVEDYVQHCEVCNTCTVRPTLKPEKGCNTSQVFSPGQEVTIDYTDMLVPVNGYRYLLVMVDAYSGWPEAYACRKEDAVNVCKHLVNHFIPTYGFPKSIKSDNGTHFKNKDLAKVEKMLGLQHKFGSVYHPQSQGKVERMNRTVKDKLNKIIATKQTNWLTALPMALMCVRMSLNPRVGYSPFELHTGRSFPGPMGPLTPTEDLGKKPHISYMPNVQFLGSRFSRQTARDPGQGQPIHVTPRVYLKVLKRKWTEPRWTGPFTVTERTSHAVRLAGKGDTWYHLSQCSPDKGSSPPPEAPDREAPNAGSE